MSSTALLFNPHSWGCWLLWRVYFIPNIQLCNIFICGFPPPPHQNMFFKQAKLRPTLWPQSEALSLGFCKEQNTLKTIRMKTIPTLSLWLRSYPDSGSARMEPEASAENSSPGPMEGDPPASFHSLQREWGGAWACNLRLGQGKEGERRRTHAHHPFLCP